MEMITGINFDGMINAQINSEDNPIEIRNTSNERVTVQSSEGNVHQENNNNSNNSNENENVNQTSLTEIDINNFISEVKEQIPSQQTSSHRTIPGQQQTQDGRKMKRQKNAAPSTPAQKLNEMFSRNTMPPRYVEEGSSGPPHARVFRIAVHIEGMVFVGYGKTKQVAKHQAAQQALDYFTQMPQFSTSNRFHPYQRQPRMMPPEFDRKIVDRQFAERSFGEPQFSDRQLRNAPMVRPRKIVDYGHSSRQDLVPKPSSSSSSSSLPSSLNSSSKNSDFTSDDYNFVEFDEVKVEEPVDRGIDQEDQEEVGKLSEKKEKIILKIMSETPVHENPISMIHELHPDLKWEFEGSDSGLNSYKQTWQTFKMKLIIGKEVFHGVGRTKKQAKATAATKALFKLYNITINQDDVCNTVNSMQWAPRTVIQIAQEPLLLKQQTANRIGEAITRKCSEIWEQLTDLKKWTVLAGIVMTDDFDENFYDVICITTGTKCIKGDQLSMNGYALNDCHAEILARRCLINYLFSQIEMLIENDFRDNQNLIIELRDDNYGFRIKKRFKFHLFISTAPCGDARVFSPNEEKMTDDHPNRITRGLLRAKIEGGEGTIPVKRDAALLTWDGILQGTQRVQFMSCSDKISVWNVVGLQGALLSHMLEPVYLESVVLGSLFNYEHFVRAIHGRLNLNFDSNSLKTLPEMYYFNKSKVAKSIIKEDLTRQLTKSPSYAVNWIKGDSKPEIISTETGKTHQEGSVSRLSKRSFFTLFCGLLGRKAPTLSSCSLGSSIPIIYRDAKTSSQDYQRAKLQVMQTFQEQNLGNWIQVPSEIDLFGL